MRALVPSLCITLLGFSACACAGEVDLRIEADGSILLTDVRAGAPEEPARARAAGAAALRALPYAGIVDAAAAEHALSPALIHAVIRAESNYDAAAVSPKGAVGLMQLMPATARELGVDDASNPASNIRGGVRYLKQLLERFDDDVALALAAYNAGPAAVVRSGGAIPAYAETRRYVPRVVSEYRRLQALAESGAAAKAIPTIGETVR